MRVLVTGGRHFDDTAFLRDVLDRIHARRPITVLIHGDAPGADTRADCWACDKDIRIERYPADWDRLGGRAGMVRNEQMLVEGKPDFAVAFRGGKGTTDMILRLRRAGVPLLKSWQFQEVAA